MTPPSQPSMRSLKPPSLCLQLAVGLGFLGVAAFYGWHYLFIREFSTDEGYVMMTVRSFLAGRPLYDEVFTQYGPAFYAYQFLLHTLTGLPVAHDVTRAVCLFHWLTTALLLGVAVGRLTRSKLAGLFTFMQAVLHLTALAQEPGHPQEVVAVLYAVGLLALAGRREDRLPVWALAGIAGILFCIKINVGLFWILALFLAVRCRADDRFARGPWAWLLLFTAAAAPFILMRQHLGESWCRNYAILAAAGITCVLAVAQGTRPVSETRTQDALTAEYLEDFIAGTKSEVRPYIHMAVALAVTTGFFLLIPLASGTSARGLLTGVLWLPLKLQGTAMLHKPLPDYLLLNVAASGVAAVVWLGIPFWRSYLVWLKTALGVAGGFCLAGQAPVQFDWFLPWTWLLVVPPVIPGARSGPASSRIFLSMAVVWQSLQAYPIAGTQVAMATVLLTPVYAICLWDVGQSVGASAWWRRRTASLGRPAHFLLKIAVTLGLFAWFFNVWCQPLFWRARYDGLVPVDLPGARLIRRPAAEVQSLQELCRYLAQECDVFITYPVYNSLYFFTGKPPPTQFNSTGWGLLSEAQQQEILAVLLRSPRSLVIIDEPVVRRWGNNIPAKLYPLLKCVDDHFQPVRKMGPLMIHKRKLSGREAGAGKPDS